jgi:hypothetical protein
MLASEEIHGLDRTPRRTPYGRWPRRARIRLHPRCCCDPQEQARRAATCRLLLAAVVAAAVVAAAVVAGFGEAVVAAP